MTAEVFDVYVTVAFFVFLAILCVAVLLGKWDDDKTYRARGRK